LKSATDAIKAVSDDSASISGSVSLSNQNDSLLLRKQILIKGDCTIDAVQLKKISIVASGTIRFGKNARCQDAQLFADSLIIQGGVSHRSLFYSTKPIKIQSGSHSSQFFSDDSIVISKEATFEDFSLIASHRMQKNDTVLTGGILVPEDTKIIGHLISLTDSLTRSERIQEGPAIVLGERTKINGTIITDGNVWMKKVSINGHVWANAILSVENGIASTNWLYGCTFTTEGEMPPFPLLGETLGNSQNELMKKMKINIL
jgi:cytoskeletal protein CcmA (bactofilin family)